MIVWTKNFPRWAKPLAYLRLKRAERKYFERLKLGFFKKGKFKIHLKKVPGDHEKIAKLHNKYKDKRCFIIGNGPSIKDMDLSKLNNEVTIGSNGLFKMFEEYNFSTTFLTMEDIAQVEDRRFQLDSVKGPTKIFGLHNAYCIKNTENTLFMNVEPQSYPSHPRWKKHYPGFSVDLAAGAFLGSTITYLNLQLAFHLGCNPIYLIGVDHSYGEISKILPPGKVKITPEILELIKKSHGIDGYHKVGGTFGVPYTAEQEKAYAKAKEMFEKDNRQVLNAGVNSYLDIFDRADFDKLF